MAKLLKRVSAGPTFIVPLSVFSLELRRLFRSKPPVSFTDEDFVLVASHIFRSRPFAFILWVRPWNLHLLKEDASIGPGSIPDHHDFSTRREWARSCISATAQALLAYL